MQIKVLFIEKYLVVSKLCLTFVLSKTINGVNWFWCSSNNNNNHLTIFNLKIMENLENQVVSEMETTAASQPMQVFSLLGVAFNIRFDGRNAVPAFNHAGGTPEPYDNDTPLEMRILATKGFVATGLFGKKGEEIKTKDWLEVFYLDHEDRFCATLFHENSARNFFEAFKALLYKHSKKSSQTLINNVLQLSAEVRTEKKTSASGIDYKVAVFKICLDDEAEVAGKKAAIEAEVEGVKLQLFREETIDPKFIDKITFNSNALFLGQDGELTADLSKQFTKQLPQG